jgi:DNA-binding MltR family transcriptional regulator
VSKKKGKPKDKPLPASAWEMWRELDQLVAELEKETDRGAALTAAAYLDAALEMLLRSCFVADRARADKLLSDPYAPLASLASRIDMAYCLGHIGPIYYETMNAIRDIRNAFAHHRQALSFDHPEIEKHISRFGVPYVLPVKDGVEVDLTSGRNRYIYTNIMIINRLVHQQRHAKPPTTPEGT